MYYFRFAPADHGQITARNNNAPTVRGSRPGAGRREVRTSETTDVRSGQRTHSCHATLATLACEATQLAKMAAKNSGVSA